MNATLSGLAQSPFPCALPASQIPSTLAPELLSFYPHSEHSFFRGLAFGLLLEAAGAVLAFAVWHLV